MTTPVDLPDGFKETTLGPLPQEWEMIPLGDIFEESDTRTKDVEKTEDIPILSMTRDQGLILQTKKFGRRVASRDTSNYKVVRAGQLVYSFPIDEGVIAILHKHAIGAVSPAYLAWEPKREFEPLYLDYLLKTPLLIAKYRQLSSRTVHRRRILSKDDFRNLSIPLPPLPEQRAIAAALTAVRRAIESTEAVIAAAREMKRSMMQHLFTYGPVPVAEAGNKILKETKIGEIREDWGINEIDSLCDQITVGIVVKPASHYVEAGIPAFRSLNIAEDKLQTGNLVFISQAENDSVLSKSKLREGDILVVRTGNPGTSCIVPAEFDGANCIDLIIVRPKKTLLNNEYLSRFFNSEIAKKYVLTSKVGLAQQHFNVGAIRKTVVPIPSLDEQSTIAQILSIMDAKIRAEEQRKSALEALFASMLHNLMTGKIRICTEG